MTAGNLFCGFAATLKILEGALIQAAAARSGRRSPPISLRTSFTPRSGCILASCIFDLLDGRLARLGGNESPFGREFDSLADIVSFGVAPALMVYRIVLHEFRRRRLAHRLASISSAARCGSRASIASPRPTSVAANKEFKGFPIPAAAGVDRLAHPLHAVARRARPRHRPRQMGAAAAACSSSRG